MDIAPNRLVPGQIVFEPTGYGLRIRVTARDANHRTLWGFIASPDSVEEHHCLVGVYSALKELLREELDKLGEVTQSSDDPMSDATRALDSFESTLQWLRNSLEVQKISKETLDRARAIARITANAERQVLLAANTLRGMKRRTGEASAVSDDLGL